MAQLDDYASKSLVLLWWAQLDSLQSSVMSFDERMELEHVAAHLGKAQTVLRRLQGLIGAVREGHRMADEYIPSGLLAKHALSGPDIATARSNPETLRVLSDAVHELASHAHNHLHSAQRRLSSAAVATSVQSDASVSKLLALSIFVTGRFLQTLERANFNVTDGRVMRTGTARDGLLPLSLLLHSVIK